MKKQRKYDDLTVLERRFLENTADELFIPPSLVAELFDKGMIYLPDDLKDYLPESE